MKPMEDFMRKNRLFALLLALLLPLGGCTPRQGGEASPPQSYLYKAQKAGPEPFKKAPGRQLFLLRDRWIPGTEHPWAPGGG